MNRSEAAIDQALKVYHTAKMKAKEEYEQATLPFMKDYITAITEARIDFKASMDQLGGNNESV